MAHSHQRMRRPASECTVSELIKRCSERPVDDMAWEEFVRRFHTTIKVTVVKTYQRKAREEVERKPQFPDDVTEDLVQAVYTRLIEDRSQALERFEGEHENSIFQYLMMISINVVRDYFRETKAQKRPKISFSLDEILTTEEGGVVCGQMAGGIDGAGLVAGSAPFTMGEIDGALKKAAGWKNRERDILIFKLHYVEGLTLDEITKALDLSISSVGVNSILSRVTKRLRALLVAQARSR